MISYKWVLTVCVWNNRLDSIYCQLIQINFQDLLNKSKQSGLASTALPRFTEHDFQFKPHECSCSWFLWLIWYLTVGSRFEILFYFSLSLKFKFLCQGVISLLVPKIGSCEHSKNDLPTHGSVNLKNKWMEIEHALFSSMQRSSWKRKEKCPPKRYLEIRSSERLRLVFGTKNWILDIGPWRINRIRGIEIFLYTKLYEQPCLLCLFELFKSQNSSFLITDRTWFPWGGGGGGGGGYTRFWRVATPFRRKWHYSITIHQRGIKVYIFWKVFQFSFRK